MCAAIDSRTYLDAKLAPVFQVAQPLPVLSRPPGTGSARRMGRGARALRVTGLVADAEGQMARPARRDEGTGRSPGGRGGRGREHEGERQGYEEAAHPIVGSAVEPGP